MRIRKPGKSDLFFLITAALLVIFSFLPEQNTVRFFVSESNLEYGSSEHVTLAEGHFGGKTIVSEPGSVPSGEPCAVLSVPRVIADDDTASVVSGSERISAYQYTGFFYAGYTNAVSLSAYTDVSYEFKDRPYFREMSPAEAVSEYGSRGYLLVFSVKGDSRSGWTGEMQKAFAEAGLPSSPGDFPKNTSYAAWVYGDEVYSKNSREILAVSAEIDGHVIDVTSGGVYSGNTSSILIDGKDCSPGRNGLNLAVYDPAGGRLIDALAWNTNDDGSEMSRADDLFEREYTIKISPAWLEQVQMRGRITHGVHSLLFLSAALLIILLWADGSSAEKNISRILSGSSWAFGCRQAAAALIMTVSAAVRIAYSYLKTSFKGVSVDQLVFHLNANLEGARWSQFSGLYGPVLRFSLLAAAGVWIFTVIILKLIRRHRESAHGIFLTAFIIRWAAVLASLVFIFTDAESFWWNYKVCDYLINTNYDSEVFNLYYSDPSETKIIFPEKKKNLIYIFAESLEISTADENAGGGKSFNAVSELTDLALKNDCFNGQEEQLNGAYALNNCTWTIAGIVAQTCGIPLRIDHGLSNKRGTVNSFLPGAYAIGDILEKEGYTNVFMLGSDAAFGNRTQFFREHGSYEIDDYYQARRTGLIPPDYFVWWGYEDSRLFEFAKDKAQMLAGRDKPFNLTLLTVDTHFTDGYLCPECPDLYQDQYSNVIACSSARISEFCDWVKSQPWGADTVIVICGDHLCMDSAYFEDMPENYERKTYTAVINSEKKEPLKKRKYATIDMFPTALSALGAEIEGDRLGLGTDLYSDTPTLLELKGRNYLDTQFSMNSEFYKENIMFRQ
ncbi:MAG: sulfatase-like hydrolase/transferase [Solobacterium sp.]|nr:sulfatase-like hydrolase/transferase [Solobacterium sp.]